jgi:hypothetical protein
MMAGLYGNQLDHGRSDRQSDPATSFPAGDEGGQQPGDRETLSTNRKRAEG